MKYVQSPNLPEDAGCVIVSGRITEEIAGNIRKFGIEIIYAPELPLKTAGISDHPDCQIAHIGDNKFVVSPLVADFYADKLEGAEIICGTADIRRNYPHDAAYNIAWVGNKVFHNPVCTDGILKKHIGERLITIKQGYGKCSVCIVDENSLITDDPSVAKVARISGADVLEVYKGDVRLRGYDYGFIGGAGGKLKKDVLAFFGDIKKHRDYEKISEFCAAKGVNIVSLSTGPLTDFGSVIPISEKE